MTTQLECILHKATNNNGPLNILCAPTHERAESAIATTGHEFWAYQHPSFKKWKEHYAPIPKNYHLLNPEKQKHQIPRWIDLDIVLSQNKVGQFQTLGQIAQQLRLPLISVEHTLPMPQWSKSHIHNVMNMQGDINVFVSRFQRRAWGYPEDFGILNHTGIDLEIFRRTNDAPEREGFVLSVNNDWINRDVFCGFNLWKEITGFPNELKFSIKVLGDTPGLSEPAKDIPELVNFYNRASVYLNTTTLSSLPTVIFEAMACEVPVVSTATCSIPEDIIEHGVNGFCSNDPIKLHEYCQRLLKDKDLARRIGKAGRKSVEEKFNMNRFVNTWNEIFKRAAEIRK